MKTKIILCHPNSKSLCAEIANSIKASLEVSGNRVEIENLYESSFDPVLSLADIELVSRGVAAPEVCEYHAELLSLDAVIFVYPVWWFDRPALLKGWFDRVFCHGFAFDVGAGGPRGKLSHLRSFVVQVAGGPEEVYAQGNLLSVIQSDISIGTLGFCGISPVQVHTLFGSVSRSRDELAHEITEIQSKVSEFFKSADL